MDLSFWPSGLVYQTGDAVRGEQLKCCLCCTWLWYGLWRQSCDHNTFLCQKLAFWFVHTLWFKGLKLQRNVTWNIFAFAKYICIVYELIDRCIFLVKSKVCLRTIQVENVVKPFRSALQCLYISVSSCGSHYDIIINLRVWQMSCLSKDSTPDVMMRSFFLCVFCGCWLV